MENLNFVILPARLSLIKYKKKVEGVIKTLYNALGIENYEKEHIELVFKLYAEEHRFYHNLSHINNLLKLSDIYKQEIKKYNLFLLAILFHDIIYEIKSKANERSSADLYLNYFKGILNKEDNLYVEALIMSTYGHKPLKKTNDFYLFLDFDLSILAADEEIYKLYVEAVRKEYTSVYKLEDYLRGRLKFLKNYIKKDRIFYIDTFQEALHEKAISNLEFEISLIEKELSS